MGYTRHHAIVVTGMDHWHNPDLPDIHAARQAAIDAGCAYVSEIVGPAINDTSSFLVAPDGSKEGWRDSNDGDDARSQFIAWLRSHEADWFSWAEVVLGEDDHEALIERHAWDADSHEDDDDR